MCHRNQVWMLTVVVAVLATSLAGCGGQPTSPPAAQPTTQPAAQPTNPPPAQPTNPPEPTAAPEKKQTPVVIVIPDEPPSFNPPVTMTGYDSLIKNMVLLGLTTLDPNSKVLPALAAELPTVENGGVVVDEAAGTMLVTWKIRQDALWADGKPVTADDVIFTFNAAADPVTGGTMEGKDYIDKIEKVDDHTFSVSYNAIYASYLMQFGGEKFAIWPQHYCDASQGFVAWDCAREPLSNGPYILQEWKSGDHLTFVRNPNYFEKGKPSIEQIIVRIVPDEAVRKTMLIKGDADVYMWASESVVNDLKNEPTVKISISPSTRYVMRLFFNLAAKGSIDPVAEPHPVLSDVRVRRAIRMAVDVDTISQQFFYGYGKPVWTEFFRPPYVCDIPRPAYDPAAAAALLEEAGWTDQDGDGIRECHGCKTAAEGYQMRMELITYAETGEPLKLAQQFIAEGLKKIGIDFKITVVESSVLWADSASGGIEQNGDFDVDLYDDGYAGIDPASFLQLYYTPEAAQPDMGYNFVRFQNEQFTALLNEVATLDEKHRQELFCQMAQILEDELPQALLFTTLNAEAYSTRLDGIQASANDVVSWNVADWQIK